MTTGKKKSQDAQRHVHEKKCPPAEPGDQPAAERRTERRADRGDRSEQSHGAAGPGLRHCFSDQGQGEGHHDRRAKALHRASCNQQPEDRGDAA
jgi:hypothetical protein